MSLLATIAADEAPAMIRGGHVLSRSGLADRVRQMRGTLADAGVDALMVCSDDSTLVLVALEAACQLGIGVTVAHTSLNASQLADFEQQQHIGALVDDSGIHLRAGRGGACGIHLMTSGSTGTPKIVTHSVQSLLARVRAASSTGERWLLTYQPTGFAGLQVTLSSILGGGTLVVPLERTPQGFLRAAREAGVTHISGTPTFWRSMMMLVQPGELSLQQVTLGGEGVDQATLDRLRRMFPAARITHTYASTEAGVVVVVHDGKAGFPAEWLESAPGRAELRIRDGYLHVRSPSLMKAYSNVEPQPLDADGWLVTSDRCEIADDRVRILGRDDAMINVAGSKVYPPSVEALLLALPEVAEARVYGVPSPIAGALVAADVVLATGVERAQARSAIMDACRRELAPYQVPRSLKFVDAIGTAPSGKRILQ
jgi:acyl-coenzyme A synthetase/AMP-(fatty) acid ligase